MSKKTMIPSAAESVTTFSMMQNGASSPEKKPTRRRTASKKPAAKPEPQEKKEQADTQGDTSSFSKVQEPIQKEQTIEPEKVTKPRRAKNRIYAEGEPIKTFTAKLPESEIELLKQIAGIYGMNATQYIRSVIRKDYEANKQILDTIMQKQKELK